MSKSKFCRIDSPKILNNFLLKKDLINKKNKIVSLRNRFSIQIYHIPLFTNICHRNLSNIKVFMSRNASFETEKDLPSIPQ